MSLPSTCQYELRIDRSFILAVSLSDDHHGPLIISTADDWTFVIDIQRLISWF